MIRAFRLYWQLLCPWLAVVVYVWLLQLMAVFGSHDPERLLDRLADWSAILWTLVIWIALAVSLLGCIVAWVNRNLIFVINTYLGKATIITATAIFFVRWLLQWAALIGDSDAVIWVLAIMSIVLAAWTWRRRKNRHQIEIGGPSLRECCIYFALPLLIAAALALGLKVTNSLSVFAANRTVVNQAAGLTALGGRSPLRPNVIVIVADALRAQNMSLYGYGRKTTPFLNDFAANSTVYTQMYANSTSTRVSMTTILSGRHPLSHGRLGRFFPAYDGPQNLMALLRDRGYTTAAVISNLEASFTYLGLANYLTHGEYTNFSRLTLSWLRDNGVSPTHPGNRMYGELANVLPFLGFPEKTALYGSADDAFHRAARLVERLPEPYFLLLHVNEPHSPYQTPAPFRDKYAKLDYRTVERKISSDNAARYGPELQPYVDAHRDHYDEAIEYLDSEWSSFIQTIGRNPKAQNSLFIFTGDHGESFERGYFIHGEDLYESSIHVPLLIRYPNQNRGAKSPLLVQSIDLAPTILRATGIAIPSWMDGKPITLDASADEREAVIVNYQEPINRNLFSPPTKLAMRRKQYKLIVSCDTQRVELYDLMLDPGEMTTLALRETGVVAEMWRRLKRALEKQTSDRRMACQLNL